MSVDRKQVTKILTDTLINTKLSKMGVHYATEVTLDMGTSHPKRVDVVSFKPIGGTYASDIEKGEFTCYEIKSCKEDVYSESGLNFYGEQNYLVMTMQTWKDVQDDYNDKVLHGYISERFPQSSLYFGVMVAVPVGRDVMEEYDNPTPTGEWERWELNVIIPCRRGPRKRSMVEMLFCMLRAGR